MKKILSLIFCGIACCFIYTNINTSPVKAKENMDNYSSKYRFPDENQMHEGTWLIWPHKYTYGKKYAESIEYIWIKMVEALSQDEKVHIIAYNKTLKNKVIAELSKKEVNMSNVDFVIAKSNDVWARDTGPMFVYDSKGNLEIADFGFNGWGKKTAYKYDDAIPKVVAKKKHFPIINLAPMVLEGGAIEVSPDGTVMGTKSSVTSKNRNPKLSQKQVEDYLRKYLGATNFIWLDGVKGEDITDAHIDGFARFYDDKTILTVPENDFFDLYEGIKEKDYQKLVTAKNTKGEKYKIEEIPLTSKNVKGLDYKGSYLNFYLGNKVVLVPVYGDKNDHIAIEKLQKLYPNRKVVPINVVPLYKNGGMIHCVTQQQPYEKEQENE